MTATSWEKEGNDIRGAFATALAETYPSMKVAYDNAPFTIPTDGSTWIRLTVLSGQSNRLNINASQKKYRHIGVVVAQIFTKPGSGDKEARQVAEVVAAIFRSTQVGGCLFKEPAATPVGTNDGWYQFNVSIPFDRDDVL